MAEIFLVQKNVLKRESRKISENLGIKLLDCVSMIEAFFYKSNGGILFTQHLMHVPRVGETVHIIRESEESGKFEEAYNEEFTVIKVEWFYTRRLKMEISNLEQKVKITLAVIRTKKRAKNEN